MKLKLQTKIMGGFLLVLIAAMVSVPALGLYMRITSDNMQRRAEMLPEYQKRGIGSELFRRMLVKLNSIANIDLTCDPDMQPFYERFNMSRSHGMILRRTLT